MRVSECGRDVSQLIMPHHEPHHIPQGEANHSITASLHSDSLLASLQTMPSHQGGVWTLTSDTHFRLAVLVCSSVLVIMLVLRLLYLRKRAKEGRLYHRLDSDLIEGQKDRESLLRTGLDGFEEEEFETHIGGLDVPLLQEVCIEVSLKTFILSFFYGRVY